MGKVDPSTPALGYVNGVAETINDIEQDELSLTLRGEPFSTWAGPVSLAVGGEYRSQSLRVNFDSASRAGAYSAPSLPYSGSVDVKEAFGELLIPLLSNSPFGKRLSVDIAGRVTNYTTSGTVETWKAGVEFTFGLRLRSFNRLIGAFGVQNDDGRFEIGYVLAPAFWGQGLATEGAQQCLDHAFKELGLKEVLATAPVINTPSIRVMEKIGMKFDYIGKFYERDLVHYSITKEEFQNNVNRES
jgi:GNAT superfamily N-acetyltransferase